MLRSRAFRRLLVTVRNRWNMSTSSPLNQSQRYSQIAVRHSTTQTQLKRYFTTSPYHYSAQEQHPDGQNSRDIPEPEKWIAVLENTAAAPWLFSLAPDQENRLKIAYTLLLQIVLYLGRPMEGDGAEQFLIAFGTAPVPSDSEIGRARAAVATITRAVVHHMSSIPVSSSIRSDKSMIFDIFGALQVIHDMYLVDTTNDLKQWSEFWERVQPVLLELGIKLDEGGFGVNLDEFGSTKKSND